MRYSHGIGFIFLYSVAFLAACAETESSLYDEDSESCSVKSIDDGYKVMCNGDSVGVFIDSLAGKDGTSCTMAAIDNGYKVMCGNDSVGVINNGIDGSSGISCTVAPPPRATRFSAEKIP